MTSSEGVHSVAKSVPSEHRPLPGQVVLVMQGGGAPGCYQAGVYQAMHEAGIEPDWVIGTSIGAINGAIIAGNKDADRLERLHEFWSCLEGWCAGPWGSLTTLLTGVPGFFSPNPAVAWGVEARVGIERAALYSIDPLKKLLPKLVDFDLINSGKPRFTLGLVNVRSGQMRYFDSREGAIGLDHVLGSSALPPSFPAVRVDGEAYWDGGIYSNTPVEVVFDENPRRSSVVFTVQIWHTRGPEPDSIAQVFMRQKDILFGSRSRSHIARQAQLHRMRHVVRELFKMLPEERRNTPEAKELAAYGCATVMNLLEINARPIDSESNMRDFDFSKAAIQARWQAGYAWPDRAAAMGESSRSDGRRRRVRVRSRRLGRMAASGVRRGKAALFIGRRACNTGRSKAATAIRGNVPRKQISLPFRACPQGVKLYPKLRSARIRRS